MCPPAQNTDRPTILRWWVLKYKRHRNPTAKTSFPGAVMAGFAGAKALPPGISGLFFNVDEVSGQTHASKSKSYLELLQRVCVLCVYRLCPTSPGILSLSQTARPVRMTFPVQSHAPERLLQSRSHFFINLVRRHPASDDTGFFQLCIFCIRFFPNLPVFPLFPLAFLRSQKTDRRQRFVNGLNALSLIGRKALKSYGILSVDASYSGQAMVVMMARACWRASAREYCTARFTSDFTRAA